MKKVVRLSENDLNRLVRRIVNEAPFDDSGLPNFDNVFDMNADDMDYTIKSRMEPVKKNREFEQGGFKIPMKAHDIRFLLSIADDSPNNRGRLESIQSLLDSEMRKNYTKF
jgi:hypothetical protein